ncbi:hypothetical protein OG244_26445 [Streptomyces brevispora]|uniref:hypothetical protein n=1 Tax=Streptomyces brevispora TaxID=887462 RepID=UPI002E3135B4|nr:hypothetical protein [Streptomyces brevispora]
MSENDPVNLAGIPVFTGDLALLDTKVTALTKGGEAISTAAGDIHSSFGGLQAFYRAPEADQLFATTKPVADRGISLKSDLATIAGALSTYSDDAYPLVEKLKELKRDAGAFLVKANADDKWREDGDLVEENNTRHDEITETWLAFQAVERACHAKIVALVGGHALQIDDGSGKKGTYGFDADALKDVKGLPWGDPVEESKPWWHVHEHAWDFVKGFFVDGVWGTVKGLGTLVGTDGWDAAKQAWSGLGKLATGLALSNPYIGGALFWSIPDDKLPAYLRDSRNAVKETGKALLAWDQWGENPSRAAGAVTFNVVTTVFTGGTGGAASGAGKAAVAAKALSYAGKVGRIVDPMTYVFKGAGMALTKISDVMAGFKGLGNIEAPTLPEGAITLPDGAFKLHDGTLYLPEGAAVPEGAFEVPGNSVRLPDGAEIPAGAIDLGDGVVRLPEGMAPPADSIRIPEGALKLPEGTTIAPENALKGMDVDGNTVYLDGPGNVLKEDGTLLQHHTAARKESLVSGADSPSVRPPAEQPALVGAHAAAGADGAIRMGDDLGDAGRVGDDAAGANGRPGGSANNLPGGTAGQMPHNNHTEPTSTGDHSGGGSHPTSDGGHTTSGSADGATESGSGHSGTEASGGTGSGTANGNSPAHPPLDPQTVNNRIRELDDRQGGEGHAPGRHLYPDDDALRNRLGSVLTEADGTPKIYGPNSNNPGLLKSENNVDPLTGTTVDGVHGGVHRVGPFATRFDDAQDMVRADMYFRNEIARNGKVPPETPIDQVLGTGAEERLSGYYRDPANPNTFKQVDFTDGTIVPIYKLHDGKYVLHTMFANPAPGRHP